MVKEVMVVRDGAGLSLTCSALRVVRVELLADLAGVSEGLAGLLHDFACSRHANIKPRSQLKSRQECGDASSSLCSTRHHQRPCRQEFQCLRFKT